MRLIYADSFVTLIHYTDSLAQMRLLIADPARADRRSTMTIFK